MVETLSHQGGGTPMSTANVVFGGFGLGAHWNQGTAQRRIAEGGWSIVVLQQGPSSLPESQIALREWTIRSTPSSARRRPDGTLHGVAESNRRDAFDAVGRGMRAPRKTSPACSSPSARPGAEPGARSEVPLSGPDGFRPTLAATYLASLVVYQQITAPVTGRPSSVNPQMQQTMRS